MAPSYDRQNRLGKGREESIIKWGELLEKFRSVQERARRAQNHGSDGTNTMHTDVRSTGTEIKAAKDVWLSSGPPVSAKDPTPQPPPLATAKRLGLSRQFGRLGGAVAGRGKRS